MATHHEMPDVSIPADPLSLAMVEGEVVLSATGRITTPFPRIDLTSGRKAHNTLLRADAWLIENATREAFSRGSDTRSRVLSQYRPGKLSMADKDDLCLCLFDAELAALDNESSRQRLCLRTQSQPPYKPAGQTLWLLNYTTQPGKGLTTATKAFSGLRQATRYAEWAGAHGYLLKAWDIGTLGEASLRAITRFEKWIGEFTPTAQETARIEAAVELPIEAVAI